MRACVAGVSARLQKEPGDTCNTREVELVLQGGSKEKRDETI